jgi:hypothetical protein
MDTAPLTLFARKVSASNRLLFADLRRLRRDILPDGITSREEVEVLLGLDHLERLDDEWPAYLAQAVAAFVISASEPPSIDQDTAAWLATVLPTAQPTTAAAIARTLEREGYQLSEDFAAFAKKGRAAARGSRVSSAQLIEGLLAHFSDLAHHGFGQGTGEMQTHNEAHYADQPKAGELPLAARQAVGPGGVLLWRAGDARLPLLHRTSPARLRTSDAAR